jgi:tripartite-type tricarboxylate transporter receptor subunit TctC
VPTMMESGAKDFDLTNWYGLFAPAGTPPAIVNRLNAEVLKILAEPEIKERLAKMGSAVDPLSATEFESFIRAEVPRWAAVVKKSGAKAD